MINILYLVLQKLLDTPIEFLKSDLQIVYLTARKYLEEIVALGLLKKIKKSKSNYYLNIELIEILKLKK